MARGHGQPGLVDSLRSFSDLVEESAATRRQYILFGPGAHVTEWAPYSGSVYRATIIQMFDDVMRDVVGVDCGLGDMTRVESIADLTNGTFFCDIDAGALLAPQRWDLDGLEWDQAGVDWDTYSSGYSPLTLYVQLPGGADPRTVTVVALLGFYFSTKGEVQPHLGQDKLDNGAFESLTGWTETANGAGFSSALDTAVKKAGSSSLKLVSTGAATGDVSRHQDRTTVTGKLYRLSAYYRTDVDFSINLAARLLIGNTAGTTVLYADGRDGDASGQAVLTPTGGEWRRFFFDFIAPDATTRIRLQLRAAASAGDGQVHFDACKLQRIYRWNFHEPRVSAASLADIEVGSQSIFFATKTIGIGSLALINGDGILEPILGQLLTTRRPVEVRSGGQFVDGQEIPADDWMADFYGLTRDLWVEDGKISFDLDDPTALILDTEIPKRTFNLTDYPNMDANRDGRSIPVVLGTFRLFTQDRHVPTRIGTTADGYGIYQLADVQGTPGLYKSPDYPVALYTSARRRDQDLDNPSLFLAEGTDYSIDVNAGTLTVLRNIKHFDVTAGEDYIPTQWLDFDIGASNIVAQGNGGTYWTAEGLAAGLTTVFTNAAGVTINVTYSTTTHKFTISRPSGTLNLRPKTGPNAIAAKTWWERLGFDTSSDKTGALSYTAENAVFTNPEADHFFRVTMQGIKDDAAGTYTGTPGALIRFPHHLMKFLLRLYGGVGASRIGTAVTNFDVAEFGGMRFYISQPRTLRSLLEAIAGGALADIVVDGAGVWYFRAYKEGTPSDVIDLYDRDFITFKCGRRAEDVYRSAEVAWGYRAAPDGQAEPKRNEYVSDAGVAVKDGRNAVLRLETPLDDQFYADRVGKATAKLAAARPSVAEFSARSKLVGVLPGRKVRLTRARALSATGSLDATLFRIVFAKRGLLSGITTCLAVEDADIL